MFMTGGAREHLAHLKVSPFTVRVFDSKMSTQIDVPAERGIFYLKKKLFPSDRGQTHSHLHTNECIFNNAIECVHRKWRFENRFRISTWMSDVKESVAFSEVNMQSFMDQLCERHWSGRSVIDGRRRKNGPAYVLHKVSSKFLCASK